MDTQRIQTRRKGTLPAGNDGHHFLNEVLKDYKVIPPYPVSRQNATELLATYRRLTGKDYSTRKILNRASLLDLYEKARAFVIKERNEHLDLMYDNDEQRYVMTAYDIIGESATWMPIGPLLNMEKSKDATVSDNAKALRAMARLMSHDMGFSSILDTSSMIRYHLEIAYESNDRGDGEEPAIKTIGGYEMFDEYMEYTEAFKGKPQGNLVTIALEQLAGYNKARDRKQALSYTPASPDDTMAELIREGIAWHDKGFNIATAMYDSIDLSQYENPTEYEDEENGMEPMERFIQECSENGQEVVTPEDSVGFTAWHGEVEDLLKESFEDAYSSYAYISDFYEYDLSPKGKDEPGTEKGRFIRWTMRFAAQWNHITQKYNKPQ